MTNHTYLLNLLGITDYQNDKLEYIACCIFCDEKKYNLQINFSKNVFHCWVCNKGGSVIRLIQTVTTFSREEAIKIFNLDVIDVEKELNDVTAKLSIQELFYDYKQYKTKASYPHWKTRGIKKQTVKALNLGFDFFTQRITIPVFNNRRKCVGIARRATQTEQQPKYLFTKGFGRNRIVYNLQRTNQDYTIVVEGQLDAIKLYQLGYNATCIMGTSMSKFAIKFITENFGRVYVMMDNDSPGQYAQDQVAKSLMMQGIDTYAVEYETEDPGALQHKEQILNAYRPKLTI